MNEARQDSVRISAATIGGVTALPKREKECVSPWTKPRCSLGVQLLMARAAVGKVAPSPTPRMRRTMKSEARPPMKPVAIVVTVQMAAQTARVTRGPKRSPNQPPMIWKTA